MAVLIKGAHKNVQNNKKIGYLALSIIICLLIGKLLFPARPIALYVVNSSSMEPKIPIHSLVVISKEDFNNLKEGDVIAFKAQGLGGALALHRIVRITENGVITKGDANSNEDNQLIGHSAYVGKCVFKICFFARYFALLKTFAGFIVFLILPLIALIALYGIAKQLGIR